MLRLVTFTVGDPAVTLLARQSIYRNGDPVGWLSSRGSGYTVEKSIGMGYVRRESGFTNDFLTDAECELEIATERTPCAIHRAPLYNPNMQRVRA